MELGDKEGRLWHPFFHFSYDRGTRRSALQLLKLTSLFLAKININRLALEGPSGGDTLQSRLPRSVLYSLANTTLAPPSFLIVLPTMHCFKTPNNDLFPELLFQSYESRLCHPQGRAAAFGDYDRQTVSPPGFKLGRHNFNVDEWLIQISDWIHQERAMEWEEEDRGLQQIP